MKSPIRKPRPFSAQAMAIVAVAVGIACMVAVSAVAANHVNHTATPPAFAVYLQPPAAPVLDAAGVAQVRRILEGRRFIVVADASALETAVAASRPQSIWVHRSALPSVSPAWLRDRLAGGAVIVAIDVSRGELVPILRVDGGSTPDWNPPNRSTFVAVGQALNVPYTNAAGEPASRGGTTIANDAFDPRNPAYLVGMVERVIERVREIYGESR